MKLLDTSVLVDIDRGGVDAKVRRLDEQGRHLLSAVTVTELRLGVHFRYEQGTDEFRDALEKLDRLLARFEIQPVSRDVATTAATIIGTLKANGTPLDDLHDVYIAATARSRNVPVVTGNVDHFERIENLRVIDWETF